MLDAMTRNWWVLALRGALAILFGVIAWIWPGITVLVLILMFGAYALVDGIFALVGAARGTPPGASRGWQAVAGICGILLGIMAFTWPAATGLVLLMLIAAWAVVTGVFEIMAGIRLRNEIKGEGWYIAGGIISVIFGFLLFAWPVSGAIAVIWMIGLFAILYGAAMVAGGFRLRGLRGRSGGRISGGAATSPL